MGVSERADRLREILKREYGIETDVQLMKELEKSKLDIGIFVSPAERREGCREVC